MKQELVQDWMTPDVITIGLDACLPDAHELMTRHQIRRLPVVDDNGRLIGIITLGDVRASKPSQATSLSMWELNYLIVQLNIDEIMTRDPVFIRKDDTIGNAARLMLEYRIGGLPVLDGQENLVGIITESDIFRMVVRHEWYREDAW